MKPTEEEKKESRAAMIEWLSFFLNRPASYYEKSSDEYITNEYDKLTLGSGKK